ncbi:MAG: sigma-70 family RNA polymerase sigma factor [Dehalobacter sp. 4CP]|nr:sigma-70 family RNA polymerase sigma factor [Dehalobacter sp. 4CP]
MNKKTRAYDLLAEELFDSFCKTVVRHRTYNLHRNMNRREKKVPIIIMNPDELADQAICRMEEMKISLDELICYFAYEPLYNALQALEERKLLALLLHFWEGWADVDIARRFDVSDRTIRNWRTWTLKELRIMVSRKDN